MSDKALERALRRRDEIAADINAAQQRLEELRRESARISRFIQDWHEFAGMDVAALDSDEPQSRGLPPSPVLPRPIGPPSLRRRNSKKEDVARAAYGIIEERGEPMSRSELYKALVDMGLTIEGGDPDMVLSTMLWRMRSVIARLKGGGYWMADKPYAAAEYIPGDRLAGMNEDLKDIGQRMQTLLPPEIAEINDDDVDDADLNDPHGHAATGKSGIFD